MLLKISACLLVAAAVTVHSLPVDKIKLRFKVSARGLPDKDKVGTIDPYVEVFSNELGSDSETKVGRSDTISDNENPDWGTIFEFNFDRSRNQKWHFKVYDDDHAREDDGAGRVWVDVADYVDKGQQATAHLHKKIGYLVIKSVDVQPTVAPGVPLGILPVAPGSPDTAILKFKLSASNLPGKDTVGVTDPYVELYYQEGVTGKPYKFGRSGTLTNTKSPSWGETFEYNYDRKKDQQWYFKVYDHDNLREDDGTGRVWVSVNDYVAKGQFMTVNLSKRGTLTITRADGNPIGVLYNPSVQPIPITNFHPNTPGVPGFHVPNQPGIPPYPNQPTNQQYQNQPINPTYPNQYPNQPIIPPYPNPNQPINPQYANQGGNPQYPIQAVNPAYPTGPVNPNYANQGGNPNQGPIPPYPTQPNYTPAPVAVPGPTPSKPVLVVEQPIKLRFRLSARRLQDRDLIGTSDPYVKIYAIQDGSAETSVGKTNTINDNENPEWTDTFEFTYDKNRKPRLRFLILDEDDNRRDEELGDVTIDASELTQSSTPLTVSLKQGSLTIQKV